MMNSAERFLLNHYLPIVWVVVLFGLGWAFAFTHVPAKVAIPTGLTLFVVAGWIAVMLFRDAARSSV
jgi:predicted membrane channel-forming protein YqfA (hemolysin III family)